MKFSQAVYEKLIELVRERPSPYDCKLREHKDQVLQKNLWKTIADLMGDKDITGDDWKKIRRQKRDAFLKKRKELYGQSGSAAKSVYKGPLYDQILFLCDHIPVPRFV
ncbi:transcription factor adf-1 [Plakobranchus ocellatus]|uniref:Transcription factor adf-1 n=1 Tax=Plakobranchus ocellatus TaxID=259542 RepID=A0AAV4D210_9GAST|nr:transcription factor adf-1 [Plakobranchus ocellatus]